MKRVQPASKNRARLAMMVSYLFLPLFFNGCAATPDAKNAPLAETYMVKVLFNGDGCPTGTVYEGRREGIPELVNDRDRIFWQAYDENGMEKTKNQYQIFFNPFKNESIPSKKNGSTKKKKSEKKSRIPTGSKVEYKYTIWTNTDACRDKPFDPRFKVL